MNSNDRPAVPQTMPDEDVTENQQPSGETLKGNPARKVALLVLFLLVLLVLWYTLSDRLAPYSSRGAISGYVTQLVARVDGQVTDIHVSDGQRVAAGELLFELDSRPLELVVRQAQARLAQVTQTTSASAAAISASQANVASAEANLQNARISSQRTFTLVERGILADQAADDARASLRSAEAQLRSAEAQLESDLRALGTSGDDNPDVRAAQADLERAQLDLAYSRVVAPSDGVVTNLQLALGRYVSASQPAMTFIDTRGTWISADLRENQIGRIRPGDRAEVVFDAVPGKVFRAQVHSIAWGIDPARATANGLVQNQAEENWFEPARRMPVRIELEDPSEWPESARVGGRISVVVYAGGSESLVGWISGRLLRLYAYLSYLY